jgi:hypothetical protein
LKSDKEAAEADREEAEGSYEDITSLYNISISENKILKS